MSRTRTRPGPALVRVAWRAILAAGLVSWAGIGSAQARQEPTTAPPSVVTPVPSTNTTTTAPPRDFISIPKVISTPAAPSAPGVASTAPEAVGPSDGEGDPEGEAPGLPHDIQVVRFQGPEGIKLEVLGPNPEAVPVGDGKGLATVGMKVGVGYRLRLTNIPNRPEAEIFPVVEVVGHLHRPAGIDPGKYPIRVVLTDEDLAEVADKGRLVTVAAYLEDPDQALPVKLGKDEPPSVVVSPAEDPIRVARALGRVMVVVRMGGRKPTMEELTSPAGDGLASSPCPFTRPGGMPCGLPCGPVVGTAPPAGRAWMPRDEYLCDGGDRDEPIHFGGDGGLRGIDPRDTVISFRDDKRARVLPTNTVCIYAPRFAAVRASVGPNEALNVLETREAELLQKGMSAEMRQGLKRLNQRQTPETNRHRSRPSGLAGRVFAGQHSELRVLNGYDATIHIAGHLRLEKIEDFRLREKPAGNKSTTKSVTLYKPESVTMTGIIEGPSQTVMSWSPQTVVGVEEPPKKPGIAIEKTVSVGDAEPGDTITFTITYRNMGNTPIRAASITDSLMPRLEYVLGSAQGPKGTVFTSGENRGGSMELRWDLPGAVPAGSTGSISFQAIVR